MYNLHNIPTNQAAIVALFRIISRYVGNLQPMPGVFPDYPAPVARKTIPGSKSRDRQEGRGLVRNQRRTSAVRVRRAYGPRSKAIAAQSRNRCPVRTWSMYS